MNQKMVRVLFALLRSSACGKPMGETEKTLFDEAFLPEMIALAKRHDVAHLLVYGLYQNGLTAMEDGQMDMMKAVFRYEQLTYDLEALCNVLEESGVDFMPLKGAVIRRYYAEPWMRTSCDIDVLVRKDDLDRAVSVLAQKLQYVKKEHGPHDVSLFSPSGNHVEIHFELVEEGRANRAAAILASVWEKAPKKAGYQHCREMTDEHFYFYHMAHMAKHFAVGGCGLRPFLDTWILDHLETADVQKRDELLFQGELKTFAVAVRRLNRVWFGGEEADLLSLQMQDFVLQGGVYGSTDNRVALRQSEKGGRFGYLLSRVFVSRQQLKRYYPILERHPWLMPVMQMRRWFMIFRSDVAQMARDEIRANRCMDGDRSDEMRIMLKSIGLQ